MSKNNCHVHGDKLANECHNYSESKAVALGHPEWTVDPSCTCDVGVTGPAGDPTIVTGVGPAIDKKKPGPSDK